MASISDAHDTNGTLFSTSHDPPYWRKRPAQNGTYCRDMAAVRGRDVRSAASADIDKALIVQYEAKRFVHYSILLRYRHYGSTVSAVFFLWVDNSL